jgi:hypothetical protein
MSGAQVPPGSAPGSPGPGSASGSPPGSGSLLAPHQATLLLDQVIYEQVLECVDLDALYRLEQSLIMIVADYDRDRAGEIARTIVDRALLRLPDDIRSYLHAFAGPPFDDCELCAEDAQHDARDDTRPRERPPKPRPATRLKS